jgi:hypothetical protein
MHISPIPSQPSNIKTTVKTLSKLKNIIGYHESFNRYGVANTGGKAMRSRINVEGLTFSEIQTQQQISNESNNQRVFAAGRFQIIPTTMNIIKNRLGLNSNDRYDAITQEKMGDFILLNMRTQIGNYIKGNNKGSHQDLENAINQIGYEWASMPVVKKSNGNVVGDVIKGTGQTANYGNNGGNPTTAKTDIKSMVQILIRTRIDYSGKTPIFIPTYYNSFQ